MNDWRKPCEHGRYEQHPLPGASPKVVLGSAGMIFAPEDWCLGGSPVTTADLEGEIAFRGIRDGRRYTAYRIYDDSQLGRLLIPIPDPQEVEA